MRTHIKDPSITVIMSTVGGHQDRITAAIKSFTNQTYKNATLLIVNLHPDRLVIHNKPQNIIVHELQDTFTRPVYQIAYILKHIVTDCWTILDDDDIVEPDHLEQLVSLWNVQENRTQAPLVVSIPHSTMVYDDHTEPLDFPAWWMSLFERVTTEEVDHIFKSFPTDIICGEDRWLVTNTYFDKRESDGKRTYNWFRGSGSHISNHEKIKDRGSEVGNFVTTMNYWANKLNARNMPLREITLQVAEHKDSTTQE